MGVGRVAVKKIRSPAKILPGDLMPRYRDRHPSRANKHTVYQNGIRTKKDVRV